MAQKGKELMDIKLAHMLINNLTSIPDGHDDLHFYLKTLKGDVSRRSQAIKG